MKTLAFFYQEGEIIGTFGQDTYPCSCKIEKPVNKESQVFAHNYVNLFIIMHRKEQVVFSSLRLMITKTHVKFQPNPIISFREKAEQTDKQA